MKTGNARNGRRPSLVLEQLEARMMLSVTTTALPLADAFPMVAGGQWLYAVKENGVSEVGVTDMYTTGANSFRMVESVSTHASTAYLTSTPSGIFATGVQANGISTLTFNSGLEFAPSVLTPGETFSAKVGSTAAFSTYKFTGSFTGQTTSTGKVTGWTRVVTAAGTYEAMLATVTMSFSGTGTVEGLPAHGTMTMVYTMDLAPGVGVVAATRKITWSGTAGVHSDSSTVLYTDSLTSTNNVPAPTGADLAIQFGASTLPTPSVPKDKGNVTVIVTNQGQTPAKGSMELDLYASPDQDAADGVLVAGGQLTGQAVNLSDGQSQAYTFTNVKLPNMPAGQYYLIAVMNASKSIVESNYANDTVVLAKEIDYSFGAVGARKNVILNLTEVDGTNVSFSMTGPGEGTVTEGDSGWDLDLAGTTTASCVTIKTVKGTASSSGLLSLDDITADGSLKMFSGASVDLGGSLTVSGTLGTLSLHDLSGEGGITIGGASTNKTALTFNQILDESLTCGATISSLTAATWGDSDSDGKDVITAPGLTSLTIKKGGLAAVLNIGAGGIGTLAVTGGSISGDINDAAAIKSLTVSGGNLSGNVTATSATTISVTGGDLGGAINISGAIGTLTLAKTSAKGGNVLAGASLDVGAIGTLRAAGSFLGVSGNTITLNAGAIKNLNVGGDMDYTMLALPNASQGSAPALGTMTLTGWMNNSQLLSDGNITSIKVGGMANSYAYAGVLNGALAGLPSQANHFSAHLAIGSFTITGGSIAAASMTNSDIAAWTLGTVNLGYPDNSLNGVACDSYATLSYHSGGLSKSWKKSDYTATLPGAGVVHVI